MRTLASSLVALSLVLGTSAAFAAPRVVINEFLTDVPGTDDNKEWVELYNGGDTEADIGGYKLQSATSDGVMGVRSTVTAGTKLAPGAFYVLAGSQVNLGDHAGQKDMAGSIPNGGSNGAVVRIIDGANAVIDTVVFGPNAGQALKDDTGNTATSFAPKAVESKSDGRKTDGHDTQQSGDDFTVQTPSLGVTNGGGSAPVDAGAPDAGEPDASTSSSSGESSSGESSSGESSSGESSSGESSSGESSSGESSSGETTSSSSGSTNTSTSSGGKSSSSSGGKSSSSGGKSSSSGGKSSSSGKTTSSSGGDDDDDTVPDDGGCNAGSGGSSLGLVLGMGALVALLRRRKAS